MATETYWLHEFQAPTAPCDLEDFLKTTLADLALHKDFFDDLIQRNGTAEIFIGFFLENFNTGFILNSELLRICADLHLNLSFDIYDSASGDFTK